MDERGSVVAPAKVTIRNVTRSSLSIQMPGESIRLQPGESTEVHKAYLDTAELQTLCKQGAVTQVEPRPPASGAADQEEESEGPGEPGRRPGRSGKR